MHGAVARLRSLLFYAAFGLQSAVMIALAMVVMPFSGRAMAWVANRWGTDFLHLARVLAGIGVQMEGAPARGAVLYAVKHESAFETILSLPLFGNPMIIAKQELRALPFWGMIAERYGVLFIDRDAGAATLRLMARRGDEARRNGRSIVLFAEGTRVPHGEQPALRPGFAGLYRILKLPVVPVALDSGRRFVQGQWWLVPGPVRVRFGDPIPPGLDRVAVEAQVHRQINAFNADNRSA